MTVFFCYMPKTFSEKSGKPKEIKWMDWLLFVNIVICEYSQVCFKIKYWCLKFVMTCSWYLTINGKRFCNYTGCPVLIDKRICWLESFINYHGLNLISKRCCFSKRNKRKATYMWINQGYSVFQFIITLMLMRTRNSYHE